MTSIRWKVKSLVKSVTAEKLRSQNIIPVAIQLSILDYHTELVILHNDDPL